MLSLACPPRAVCGKQRMRPSPVGAQNGCKMTRSLLAVLLAVAAVQLLGCGGASRTSTTTSPSTAPSTATPTPTSTTATAPATSTPSTPQDGIDTMAGASSRPVHVGARNQQTALLRAVRAARHEGFDRVVFELQRAAGL